MTTDEQIIAVAEWMGWDLRDPACSALLTSLDALRPVEEKLTDEQWSGYMVKLAFAANCTHANSIKNLRAKWSLTPSQRLEAICRTLFPERFTKL